MSKATILMVEDDAILAMDLQRMISQQGYTVLDPLASGEEAIAFLQDNQVDLVLMDIELAGAINGIRTAEILHQTSDIPIVFLTGFSNDPLLQQAKIAAPYGYLIKPVPERELAATLEMALHRHSLDRQLQKSRLELQKSEEKYRLLHESAGLGIGYYTPDGVVVSYNEIASRHMNGRPEDFAGKSIHELFPKEAALVYMDRIKKAINSEAPQVYEDRVELPTMITWYLSTFTRILDSSGTPLGVQIISNDITQRKQAEEENRRFKTIADNAVYGKAIADLEGNLQYVNRFFANIHGYEPEQLIGKHLSLFHSQDQMEAVDRLNATMMREGYFTTTTVWHRHQDGRAFPMLMNGNLIRDDYGIPQCLAVSAIDISAHHLAQEALRESEERFRSYFNLPLIGFAITSLEKGWIEVNERLCEIFGYPREELVTLTWTAITHPEDIERDVAQFNRILEGVSDNYSLEKRFIRKDGSVIHGSISVCCVRKSDRTINYFVALVQDITDRKRAEEEKKMLTAQLQQAQKLEAIGTLAGGIAHDFNNMLGAILGYAEIIRDDFPPDSPGIHDIDQILKASHRAKDLVKQILAFSRQAESHKIPIQPALIVKEAITLLRSSLPSTITIKQNIDPDVGIILADPIQIHQTVMNLCTNAFHAMEVKGGTLTISLHKTNLSQDDLATEPDLQPGTFVQLSIKDTGEGILPEIRERIFDPFFTTKEVGKGTGLGLSMVYSIVKSSGGSIACDSRVGEGTEFRIILPALEGHAVQENGSPELTPHGKEHILLIDDEEILVELSQTMLERLGYQVTTRRNSLDALTTFQNQPDAFDLVITDQTMPGMTGVDLARRILQIRPEMPIILCTGYSSLITEDKAKAAGIKGFALKPLAKKYIGELIRKILDGRYP